MNQATINSHSPSHPLLDSPTFLIAPSRNNPDAKPLNQPNPSPNHPNQKSHQSLWLTLACILLALATTIFPIARSFLPIEVGYNEGWNINNASLVTHHAHLYAAPPAWTTVNYPMLSFALMAALHTLTHDYLYTGRIVSILSLFACAALIAAIAHRLGVSRVLAILAAFYTAALFCTDADAYVGMDDPQLLALAVFLLGLYVYIRNPTSRLALTTSALLFVVGGNLKHNPIDIPLAVLIDVTLRNRAHTLYFALPGLLFAAASYALNLHFGGPFFLAQILAPRTYSTAKALDDLVNVFGPLLIPTLVALYTAWILRRDPTRRIAALLLLTSLFIGGYFGGGVGVSINALFSAILAVALLIALFWQRLAETTPRSVQQTALAASFLWLLIPWLLVAYLITGDWSPIARYRKAAATQPAFAQQLALLRSTNGPALCESILLCTLADKPYLYDPFNATRLIAFHKLVPTPMLEALEHHRIAAIQFNSPLTIELGTERGIEPGNERWPPAILEAIKRNYAPALTTSTGEIYLPTPRFPTPKLSNP